MRQGGIVRGILPYCGAIIACGLFGQIMLPLNQALEAREQQEGLRLAPPAEMKQDALSRQLALFTLGGLRTLAAEILSLDATSAWMKNDWSKLEQRYHQMTMLNPNRIGYWSNAAYDLGINAESNMRERKDLPVHEREVLRTAYMKRAIQFLEDGINYNPQNVTLYTQLGDLYSDMYRRPNFRKAAEAYGHATELGASSIVARKQLYNLSRVHGREQEAYELARKLFEEEYNRVPSLLVLLFTLQEKANIAQESRLSALEIFGSLQRARKELEIYLNNDLLYPTNGIEQFLKESASN